MKLEEIPVFTEESLVFTFETHRIWGKELNTVMRKILLLVYFLIKI